MVDVVEKYLESGKKNNLKTGDKLWESIEFVDVRKRDRQSDRAKFECEWCLYKELKII